MKLTKLLSFLIEYVWTFVNYSMVLKFPWHWKKQNIWSDKRWERILKVLWKSLKCVGIFLHLIKIWSMRNIVSQIKIALISITFLLQGMSCVVSMCDKLRRDKAKLLEFALVFPPHLPHMDLDKTIMIEVTNKIRQCICLWYGNFFNGNLCGCGRANFLCSALIKKWMKNCIEFVTFDVLHYKPVSYPRTKVYVWFMINLE